MVHLNLSRGLGTVKGLRTRRGAGKAILFGGGAFCLQIAWRRVPALPRLESPRDKAAAATRR